MPELTTEAALVELFKQRSAVPFLRLIKLDHPDWPAPYYFAKNTDSVVHNGVTYQASPVDISLPSTGQNKDADLNVTLDLTHATAQDIMNIRDISTMPTAEIFLVIPSDPNVKQFGSWKYDVKSRELTSTAVKLRLSKERREKQRWPRHAISPANTPGLYRGTVYAGGD